MNPKDFTKLLNEARELMSQDKFTDAMVILERLKRIDKESEHDYDYNLIHQLYQLDSNCRSAYNQQIILNVIKKIPNTKDSLSISELNKILKNMENLSISEEILRREVEILILRNLLQGKMEGDHLFLNV